MTLVECTYGYAETKIGGITYSFDRDEAGRFVAEVAKYSHVMLLVGLEHYRIAPALEPVPLAVVEGSPPVAGAGTGAGEQTGGDKNKPATVAPPVKPPANDTDTGAKEPAGPETDGPAPSPPAHDAGTGTLDTLNELAAALGDDLTAIVGIGPATVAKLAERGITTFAQIAAMSDEAVAQLDENMGLRGLIARRDWVGQAKKLAEAAGAGEQIGGE